MKTTLGKLKEFGACTDRYEHLCECLKQAGREIKDDTKVSILEILNFNGVQDAFWALRTKQYKNICLILADVAESVLSIWEVKFPNDNRPRKAIQAIRDYKAGKISKVELKSYADDADAAAYAAGTGAYDAGAYADAAAYAAYDAGAAAYAAHYAASSAYADAAYYAAHAAAAYAAADAKARNKQWDKNEEILRKHLTRKKKL